jgi:3-hydroxyacyl-[acyl-carrier-protein] dehydratase
MVSNLLLSDDNFYSLVNYSAGDSHSFTVTVRINEAHSVFGAHFPGNPVIPGVCILQIATELLSRHVSQELIMTSAKNIKFVNKINPMEINELNFDFKISSVENTDKRVTINVSAGSKVFVKISAVFNEFNYAG